MVNIVEDNMEGDFVKQNKTEFYKGRIYKI